MILFINANFIYLYVKKYKDFNVILKIVLISVGRV